MATRRNAIRAEDRIQSIRLAGKEFVVLPKRQYERLVASARELEEQERGDIAESRRRLAEPGKSISLEELKRTLGR